MRLNTEKHISYDEGVSQGKLETAKSFLKNGTDISIVSISTGIPIEQLQQYI